MANHFKLRTYQRVLLCRSCYYLSEDFLGKGIVWDISPEAGAFKATIRSD